MNPPVLPILGFLLLGVFLIPLWLAPASELLAVLRSLRSRGSEEPPSSGESEAGLAFVVPAHDEEAMIGRCVRSLINQDYPPDSLDIVVVADNCSDRTAELARAAGARCLERYDSEHPGKPRAIAWALARLPLDDFDLCIVVDADTITDRDFAKAVIDKARGRSRDRVMQAYNGIMNERETWLTRLSGLHTRIRYESQYPRKRVVGLNCPLAGNGMCFGTDVLADIGWTAFSVGEDWELYAQYTICGIEIDYVPKAKVYAAEASSLRHAGTQRRRWMAGRLWVARKYARRIITSPNIDGFQKLDVLGELVTPSPVIHGLLALAIALGALRIGSPLSWLVAALALGSLGPLCLHTLNALVRHPQPWKTLFSFLLLPPYALWRSANAFLTVITMRHQTWKRADRDATVDVDNAVSRRLGGAQNQPPTR